MIVGTVNASREAVIQLQVGNGGHAPPLAVDALIDTGYNGDLTLPGNVIAGLGLAAAGARQGMLADGTVSTLEVFLATVSWHGKPKDVLALKVEGAPLVGMRLLHDCRLTVEVRDGGNVRIEQLP